MKDLKKILIAFLIISFCHCSTIEFQEINTFVKTEFNVNQNEEAYFKYKLETDGPIALHFHLANLYTVQVFLYKSDDEEAEPVLDYFLAKEQFKEIDTKDFDDYVYIVIKETYKYFYKDYITIYNPNEVIQLKPNEPLAIKNFLSNNLYKLRISSENNMTLVYNTFNTENNKRKITIFNEEEKIFEGEDSEHKVELSGGEINIEIENFKETEIGDVDFSIIIYEKKNLYDFNEIIKNKPIKTNYIYNSEKQTFYYYADITNVKESNTLNFKLYFKYYLFNNNTEFFTDIIYLDNEITQEDLENNIPTESKLPLSYDDDSDEYFRIYFHDDKNDNKYKYLLVKLEIIENQYYRNSRNIEVSLGNEVQNYDLENLEYNKAFTIEKKIADYIPVYFKLLLKTDETYLLTSQNQDLTIFIKGDLLDQDNEINKDYLNDENEIVILPGIKELTVKIFGSSTSNITFYVEKIKKDKLMFAENKRKNQIFDIQMNEEECNDDNIKYILGTYDYETYAYGEYPINYYATYDSGEFEIYFKNKISIEKEGSLFPSEQSQSKEFNKRINLNTNIDLFTIKCKRPGSLSIRPDMKSFDETTHIIDQNSIKEITLFDHSEIIQLTTLLGQKTGLVYFSILSLDGVKINIIPDTKNVFEEKSIENDELFSASVDLSKYKMDQLAIRVNCSLLEKNIEVSEIIHNKYNTYRKMQKGNNTNINLNNAYIQINENISEINVTIENLQNKQISYGVIKSASNDDNYLFVANVYENTTTKEINDKKEKIIIENIYYNNKDNKKPYLYLLVSVLGKEDNLDYNINVEIPDDDKDDDKDDEKKDDNNEDKKNEGDDNTALIVFIALVSAIVLGFIVLALYMCVIKKRNINIEDEKVEKLYSQNLREIDP